MKHRNEKTITFVYLGDNILFSDQDPMLTAASVYGMNAKITPGSFEISQENFDIVRRQWNAINLINQLKELKVNGGYDLIVGITDNDIFVPGSNFVFGYADPLAGSAIVSVKRLRELADSRRVSERVYKELTHEIGHLVGLKHCDNDGCIMNFADSVDEVDAKLPVLCQDCSSKIKS